MNISGSVLKCVLSEADQACEYLDGNSDTINFIHVKLPEASKDLNLTEYARIDESARSAIVGLASRDFYTYKHDRKTSSLVHRRSVSKLWKPVVDKKILESDHGVYYSMDRPLSDTDSPKLLVIFPAMYAPIYSSSLYRYATRNYKSIQKFISPTTAVMRLVDLGGVVGNYYMNTSLYPRNIEHIQNTIRDVMGQIGADIDSMVFLGSSKGGTGALYHGLDMGVKHVAVDPIVSEKYYWEHENDPHFTKNPLFNSTKDESFEKLEGRLKEGNIWNDRLSLQTLITSTRSPQFEYIDSLLIRDNADNAVFINENEGIEDHPDVPVFSLHCATSAVDQLLMGGGSKPGRFVIDRGSAPKKSQAPLAEEKVSNPADSDGPTTDMKLIVQGLQAVTNELKKQSHQMSEHGRMFEVLGKAVLRDVLADVDATIQSRQMSMMETMDSVIGGSSLSRWGDGEIRLMLQPEFELSFQKPDCNLADELKKILYEYDSKSSDLLLAFPTVFTSRLWMGIWADVWHELGPLLKKSTARWANTHVSRPLFFQKHGEDAVQAWRSVWDKKRVCVIAGRGSRFELLPQLFDNVASVDRIDSLPRDAYSEIDSLIERIENAPEADIYLSALGPTGTALSARLSSTEHGSRHAIDVGHLASSYANVFLDGKFPEQLSTTRSI